jgi:catechol 2,3-dioxygenase-like lactoylglutathione lyase family enzyme
MIQHLTREISPSKLQDCVRFYGILGFERVPEPPGIAGRAVWLERRNTQIHLMPTPAARPDGGHVGLVVADYPLTIERLRAAGHEVEPRREHWGSPRAYVRDPAGHLVEVMAFAPGGSAGSVGSAEDV